MARRFVRAGFTRGPRKATDWSASSALVGPVSIPANTKVLLETFIPIAGGETVIRVRGMFAWTSDQQAASEEQFGAFGICVVSDIAAAAGVASIPSPGEEAAWGGWLYHSFFFSKLAFASGVGIMPGVMHRIEIDSKAMRKVDEDDRLVVVVENTHTTHGFRFANSERILSKVH